MSLTWTLKFSESEAATLRAVLERADPQNRAERRLVADLLRGSFGTRPGPEPTAEARALANALRRIAQRDYDEDSLDGGTLQDAADELVRASVKPATCEHSHPEAHPLCPYPDCHVRCPGPTDDERPAKDGER